MKLSTLLIIILTFFSISYFLFKEPMLLAALLYSAIFCLVYFITRVVVPLVREALDREREENTGQ